MYKNVRLVLHETIVASRVNIRFYSDIAIDVKNYAPLYIQIFG